MLLPQSSAFAALKNRLNSVSNIGFLHGGPRRYSSGPAPSVVKITENFPPSAQIAPTSFDRPTGTRLKPRDENAIRWVDLLDKFKAVQERARRSQTNHSLRNSFDQTGPLFSPSIAAALSAAATERPKDRSGLPDVPRGAPGGPTNPAGGNAGLGGSAPGAAGNAAGRAADPGAAKAGSSSHKHKSSLPNLGRLGIGGRKSKK
jgi:hypothetical protein